MTGKGLEHKPSVGTSIFQWGFGLLEVSKSSEISAGVRCALSAIQVRGQRDQAGELSWAVAVLLGWALIAWNEDVALLLDDEALLHFLERTTTHWCETILCCFMFRLCFSCVLFRPNKAASGFSSQCLFDDHYAMSSVAAALREAGSPGTIPQEDYFFLSSFGSHLVLIWFSSGSMNEALPPLHLSNLSHQDRSGSKKKQDWPEERRRKKRKTSFLCCLCRLCHSWAVFGKRLVTFGFAVSCCIAKVPPRHCTSCVTLWSKHPPCLRLALHCHEEEWRAAWSQRISPVGACWRAVKQECVSNLKCFIVYQ